MKKKLAILIPVILTLLLIVAGVITYLQLQPEEVVKTGNKANVEWYSEDAEEFTITTVDEFYELAKLSDFYDFKDQTVKLGADLVLNEGNAADWGKDAPKNKWYPIRGFAGTFDGQGHTISGVYGIGMDVTMGLFAETQPNCVIKDFKLLNSYFEEQGSFSIGSISGSGSGKFSYIYSDAIVVSDGMAAGGLIGEINGGGKSSIMAYLHSLSNCWFDGSVTLTNIYDGMRGAGLVATVSNGTLVVEHCLNTGTITGPFNHLGGLVGYAINKSKAIININDCFNSGKVNYGGEKYNLANGSILARLGEQTSATITNTAATLESHYSTLGASTAAKGYVVQKQEKSLIGYGGYQWTQLDFDNYWAVQMDSTPILKYFAEEVPSLDGVKKAFDTSWYDETKKEYLIDSVEDFWGLQMISQGMSFEGKTIKLGADITINTGKASDWAKEAPEHSIAPLGTFSIPFKGTLDGQGHTISGVYVKKDTNGAGLFAATQDCTIKNLKLTNSYFESTATKDNAAITGSIAGRFGGTLEKVYSDAIVVAESGYLGGMVGQWSSGGTMSECWFAGSVTSTGKNSTFIGGFAGIVQNPLKYKVEHCLNTGEIHGENTKIGGLVGVIVNKGLEFTMDDSFNAGKVGVSGHYHVGSAIGAVLDDVKATVTRTATTTESSKLAYTLSENSKFVGAVVQKPEELLSGTGGYVWTELDFKNYWSIVKDSTPVLKCFAKSSLSVAGLERKIDTSWYSGDKDTYYIDSIADLNGFAEMTKNYDFVGKTIVLKKDITYNTGDANQWGSKAPANEWKPMGSFSKSFAGTLDGQGHTISGLYVKQDTPGAGLFAAVHKGTIKNLKLTNSYFESTTTKDNAAITGSIAGRFGGTLEKVYSDAIVVSGSGYLGGLVGQWSGGGTMSECWFDGSVTSTEKNSVYIGGLAGIVQNPLEYKMAHCLNTGDISGQGTKVGGLAGVVVNKGLKFTMEDCLNAGQVSPSGNYHVGSVIGGILDDVEATVMTTSATLESSKLAYTASEKADFSGWVIQKSEAVLSGNGGYEWTELDFKNYWAIVKDSTPILKCFAKSSPSISGLDRQINTGWYNEEKDTYYIDFTADFNGFAVLTETNDFAGKTIVLRTDVVLNIGDANKWGTTAPKNVWKPMGSFSKPFAGKLDGNGHTISGLYVKQDTTGAGLFTATNKCTIKDLKLANSYIESTATKDNTAIAGSIAGRFGGTLEKVYSDAIVVTKGSYTGGFIGQWSGGGTMNECWFDGSVTVKGASSIYVGGLAGILQNPVDYEIVHCLNTAYVSAEAGYVGGFAGVVANTGLTLHMKDCLNVGIITSTKSDNVASIIGGSIASPAITFETITTAKESHKVAATQTAVLKTAGYIVQIELAKLKGNGGYEWTELDFKNYWAIVSGSTPVLQHFADKVPSVDSLEKKIDTGWFDKSKDTYELEDEADLYGFAALSQTYDFSGKTIILKDDMTLNTGDASIWGTTPPANVWSPIGSFTLPFAGTFDGDGHTISGLYMKQASHGVGLFTATNKCTIKNLKIRNSYIESTTTQDNVAIAGSVAGRFGGILEKVYSDAIIKTYGGYTGGLVGQWSGGGTMSECWFVGAVTVTGANSTGNGGLAGNVQNGLAYAIRHCLNTGTVTAKAGATGGLCGYVCNTGLTLAIDDSMNTGTVTSDVSSGVGAIIGNQGSGTPEITITNTCATTESHAIAFTPSTLIKGYVLQKSTADLSGNGGYEWSELDFKDYWSLVSNSTPVLKHFAESSPSTEGLKRKISTKWYKKDADTYELETLADLIGFTYISQVDTFKNKTVKLMANITVNEGTASVNGFTMTNGGTPNIWKPIGNMVTPFEGIFDGGNHKLIGVYAYGNTSHYLGFFQNLKGTVQNLKLMNSYIRNDYQAADNTAAGLVGMTGAVAGLGSGTISNVYSEAIVIGVGNRVGGFVGFANDTLAITNCENAGTVSVTGDSGQAAAGFIGAAWNKANVSISHCLNTGTINGKSALGGFVGVVFGATLNITDSLNSGTVKATSGSFTRSGSYLGMFYNNAVATISNCYVTTNCFYVNTTAQSKMIGFASSATLNTVAQTAGDNGLYPSAANGVTEYAKDKISGIGGRIYTNLNFKEYWSAIEGKTPELTSLTTGKKLDVDDSMKLDTSWYKGNQSEYTIDSVGELYGLAELSQNNSFANVTIKLGKNITVNTGKASEWGTNAYKWLPIGTTNYPFAGTFDGDGYTISGLYGYTNSEFYLGFIRKLTGTVQNLKLTNSSFKSEYKANDGTGGGNVTNVGAVAGWAGGTIQNIYSEATVYGNGSRVGGFAGYCNSTLAIINCWNKGEVTGGDAAVGGFLGAAWVNANISFNNCLNSGNVKAAYHLGGYVGQAYGSGCRVSIGDCVNTGTITATTGTKRNSSFIGVLNGTASLTVSDTYATTESTSFGAVGLVSGATVNGTYISVNQQPAYYENTANQTNKISGTYEVAEATLKSDAQAATPKLDWNTYWKVGTDGLPVLKQSTLK